jgi:hypothetical protein
VGILLLTWNLQKDAASPVSVSMNLHYKQLPIDAKKRMIKGDHSLFSLLVFGWYSQFQRGEQFQSGMKQFMNYCSKCHYIMHVPLFFPLCLVETFRWVFPW